MFNKFKLYLKIHLRIEGDGAVINSNCSHQFDHLVKDQFINFQAVYKISFKMLVFLMSNFNVRIESTVVFLRKFNFEMSHSFHFGWILRIFPSIFETIINSLLPLCFIEILSFVVYTVHLGWFCYYSVFFLIHGKTLDPLSFQKLSKCIAEFKLKH